MHEKNIEKYTAPTIIAILGATGDLSTNKLLPSLFDLHQKGLLPNAFKVVGFSRKPLSDEDFRKFAKEAILKKSAHYQEKNLGTFLECLSYQPGDLTKPDDYEFFSEKLISIENSLGQCSNKLFYLAVPPDFYDTIFRNLADSGLTIPCSQETGWTRILVEKPFGNNVETAQELDKTLGLLFKEEQIFRIDHYLGKEALQDILMFRFSNLIFEPLWNNNYIEKIEITLLEASDVSSRGAFYDGIGALRDVGQNHLLQMLATVAMDDPNALNAKAIRRERAKILESLRPITEETTSKTVVRGQYNGYTEEKNVGEGSQTETYFKIKAYIDNERWKGVPFYLESGKALGDRKAEIKIYFRETGSCLCPEDAEQHHQNILTFRIQPDEGISILFWAKRTGFTSDLEPKKLSFSYNGDESGIKIPDAYERILFDSIVGDQTLFTSTEEVAAAWRFITSILNNWSSLPLHIYEKGGMGPEEDSL